MNKNFLPIKLITFLLLCTLSACVQPTSMSTGHELRIIGSDASGYGYEIWKEGKRLIRQENLPTFEGIVRCPDRACAQRIGEVILQKLNEGQFPPTMEREEIEKLMEME